MKLVPALVCGFLLIAKICYCQNTSTIGKNICFLTGMNIFETNGNSKVGPYKSLNNSTILNNTLLACSMLGRT